MLAEANISVVRVGGYFGQSGNRLHRIFNFMLNQHIFLTLARNDVEPFRRIMICTPAIPRMAQ